MRNGKDSTLDQSSGTVPDMSSAILQWLQPMTFTVITKSLVNFQLVETTSDASANAVIQPYTAQQLQLRPEGERSFRWHTLHADTSLVLNIDDVILYQGVKYRVMIKGNYSLYGYVEYHIIEDYQ